MTRSNALTRQGVLEAYAAWLKMHHLVRSPSVGSTFASQVTNAGRARFDGLSEEEVCTFVGGELHLRGSAHSTAGEQPSNDSY